MPIHPQIASKFPLLEGITSVEAAMADPAQRAVLDEFMSITGAPEPPRVATRDDTAPGPHGPVPVRVYEPDAPGPDRPALVWLHGGAFVGGDLDMPEADWTARRVCARAGVDVRQVTARGMLHGFLNGPPDFAPVEHALALMVEHVTAR